MHRMFSNVHLTQIWTNFDRHIVIKQKVTYEISLQPGSLVSLFPYYPCLSTNPEYYLRLYYQKPC